MTLSQTWEEKRDLLTEMNYMRGGTLVASRSYEYDPLARPTSRSTYYPGKQHLKLIASFGYNDRSELTAAKLDASPYAYAYDNVGNRISAREDTEQITYEANKLNQYTLIKTNGADFIPDFDADGNQTLIQTSTGIWHVTYNAQNRATRYESADGSTIITCVYDYMGRRVRKQVVKDGVTTLDDRFFYRGYLQVAAYDWLPTTKTSRYFLVWDPTQSVATRPLAIRTGGTAYAYGWDLTKNICELYGPNGYIVNRYAYTPFGSVTQTEGSVNQPFTWSSEAYDEELGLVYYNFRYYNPCDGRWTRREPMMVNGGYVFCDNNSLKITDQYGLLVVESTLIWSSVTISLTSVAIGLGIVAAAGLLVWGVYSAYESWTEASDDTKDDVTTPEPEWNERRRDVCAMKCTAIYHKCLGLTYYPKECKRDRVYCESILDKCLKGCYQNINPQENEGIPLKYFD